MKNKIAKRSLSTFLILVLLLQIIPGGLFGLKAAAAVNSSFDRVSDYESLDYWKGYFSNGDYDSNVWSDTISTQNAGAVWTDKSVFVPEQDGNITIDGVNVPLADTGDNFLVSMSVMASNKTVKGYEYIPTSTMLVLDVSGSMGNGSSGNSSWDEMVEATNKAIETLLNLNSNNLVGVVLYSGNSQTGSSNIGHSTLILPLDRYTTTATNNNGTNNRNDDYPEYLTAQNSTVGVNSAVRPRQSGSKSVTGGTYIQGGIYRAMEELIDEDAPKQVAEGVQMGMDYTPIVVLMSDGAPTAANLDYDFNQSNNNNHATDIGNGTATDERMGFLTQLTAAYAKARIDEAYGKSPLFYTLGLGLDDLSSSQKTIAKAVLNPKTSSENINTYWNSYLRLDNDSATSVGNTMYLNNNNSNAVVKNDYVTADYRNYVTQYFEATASGNVSLEQSLINSFEQIVDAIVLQSVYYPTEIGGNSADISGYVTFRDELGEYMDIKHVVGILFEDEDGNQTLHTGAMLAKNFVSGGGDLGQVTNPKPLGDELVRAVKSRLGIEDTVTAQNLITNAYHYGQLSYVDDNNFSNYIGYYGDEDGKFVDFWHEGHTDTEQEAAISKGAKFIYKSYGYLGEVNKDLGIKASDMMYTSVQVRKTIAEVEGTAIGEIVVEGSIPASLIPTITYEVTLNGKTYESGVQNVEVTDTSARFPARLVYEVGLRSDINPINIAEKLGNEHKNTDGTYTLYTNDWEFVDFENNEIADTSVNAFTHFEPAYENERYYYITDSLVYSAANESAAYTGNEKPTGDGYFHSYRVFSVTGNQVSDEITYIKTSPDALSHAVKRGDNWYIPAGTGKHEIVGYQVSLKRNNNTETNRFTAYPKIKTDVENSSGAHTHHYSVVTFGNNGKLTVTPATGIKITKALDQPSSTEQTFEFNISGAVANESYIATPLDEEGNFGTATIVTADSSGVITVNLLAGTSLYVTGLAAGNYTVTESEHSNYRVLSLEINGETVEASNSATVSVVTKQTSEVSFVNTLKGYGSLYITKEVVNALDGQELPEYATSEEFDITLEVGTALSGRTFEAAHSTNNALESVTVGTDGNITGLKIKHGETIVIRNLPENTTATVREEMSDSQVDFYTVAYSSHDRAGEEMDNNGEVFITKNANATVIVKNTYKPVPTSITIGFDGTKSMDATNLSQDKTFNFVLEKYENGWTEVDGWNASATVTAGLNQTGVNAVGINFNNFTLDLSYTNPGVEAYRIYEQGATTADGITYDPSIYNFVVTVVDNNGQLEATVTGRSVSGSGDSYTVNASFTNAYNTEPVIINVNKVVIDATKDNVSFAGYEFELYNSNIEGEYSAADLIDTEVSDQNGDARFSWLADSNDAGTHYYIIKEKLPENYIAPEAPNYYGWNYDTREILVKVDVSVDNNIVSAKINDNATNTAEYTFTNEYKAAPAILSLDGVATKTLNGRDLVEGEFTFFLNDAEGQLLAEGKNTLSALDGTAAPIKYFKVGSNEEFELVYTKAGTYHYKLGEVQGNLGGVDYTSRIFDMVVEVTDNGSGALLVSYFFEDSTEQTVNFVNTYSVKTPTSIELEATKKLTGDRQMLTSEFNFNVYEMTDDSFDTKKFENAVARGSNIGAEPDANGVAEATFKFSELYYTKPGIHYYQISETAEENAFGITYDSSVKNIVVEVIDNLDGTITARVIEEQSDELVFTNAYTPSPVSVQLEAEKTLNGRPLKDGEFEFALFEATVQDDGSKQVWTAGTQVGENVKNAENGNIKLPEVEFTAKGTYYYIAKEVIGTKGGVAYDETEFHITFTVTDDHKGTLSVDTIITNHDNELSLIVFNNEYTTENAQLVLEATKTLLGRDMIDGEFSFVIKEDGTVVAEGKNTAANDGVGADIVFEAIEYTLADVGEHTYTIEEVIPEGDKNGVTYDENSFTVTVTVSDNEDGTLLVVADKTKADIAFTNGYSAENVTVDLFNNAKKTLEGRVMNTEEFIFELYEMISSEESELIQSAKNDAEGNFSFNPITYDEVGVYEYLVKEFKGDKGGIIYDDTVYSVTVTVTDNLFGKLFAKVTITDPEENEVDELIFKNLYKANETGVVLEGSKKVVGEALTDKQFTFELYEADNNFEAIGDAIQAVKNSADGSVIFEEIKFTEAGTYRFIIIEKNDAQKNYTYDNSVWHVTIEVTDSGEGELIAEKTVIRKGDKETSATFKFENIYIAEEPPKTGDTFNIWLWLTLFLISAASLGTATFCIKKKGNKNSK